MGEGEPKSAAEKAPKNKQDMRARLYGALLLLPLLLFLWVGGLYFSVILIALCALMSFELAKMAFKSKPNWQFGLMVIWLSIPAFMGLSGMSPLLLGGFLLLSFSLFCWQASLLAGVYACLLGLCFYALLALQNIPDAQMILVYLIAVTSAVDIGAYFVGRTLGGPKLAPFISPGKTISGGLGGVGAGLLAFFALEVGLPASVGWPIGFVVALTLLAQLGDLLESGLKRQCQVKDSSQIIPGHGGVLDRFDGYVLTLPLLWLWFYQG